jgi:hypothetical protein
MKLLVTFDDDGNVLALGPLPPPPARGKRPAPRLLEGQHMAELEVPYEQSHLPLLDIHRQFQVDVKSGTPRLVAKT